MTLADPPPDPDPPEPVALLGQLADEVRLRVFAAVVLGAGGTPAVAAAAGLRERDAVRALARLESAGLVRRQAGAWAALTGVLSASVASATPRDPVPDPGVEDPAEAAVLRRFMPRGVLESIPAVRSKRLVVLDHVARVFEPGQRYPEREVNTMLRAFHPDYAAVRRYLVDEGFLTREAGIYWRSGGTVVLF